MTEDETANDNAISSVMIIVYDRFREWGVTDYGRGRVVHLANLLGYKTLGEMNANLTPRDAEVLRMLTSEHGYTVYKMLLARQDTKHE